MNLKDFKPKPVQGLYSYDHFEGPDGAFIQSHHSGDHWVFQAPDGSRKTFYQFGPLKAHVEAIQ